MGLLLWLIAHPWAGIPLLALGRCLFVFAMPYRECRWCRRGGPIQGSWLAKLASEEDPRRRRKRRCWRCKGTRITRRWGAWHMHKIKIALMQARDEWEDRR